MSKSNSFDMIKTTATMSLISKGRIKPYTDPEFVFKSKKLFGNFYSIKYSYVTRK